MDVRDEKPVKVFFYSRAASKLVVHGQFELTYGASAWKLAHTEALKNSKAGESLRLGNNFFATFDTSCPVEMSGVELAAGEYCLAMERGADDSMSLVFLDPAGIRAKKLDSNQTSETNGGIAAAMTWREVAAAVEKLEIALRPAAKRGTKATLCIRFGKQELTGTLRALVD